ncbi:unnamed protein product [Prunus armeniaca]|uniref:Cathepsin propeptide inhibitor domain-containing protein n=1 Tax=Prunus armeniaca TaxID=36596 RepID=A0A6J5XAV3_PRUAR|nr:unnamed protein product [Prunus armeniaca]
MGFGFDKKNLGIWSLLMLLLAKAMSEEATSPSPSPTATSISSDGYPADVAQAFEQWMKEYERDYSTDEEKERRFANFKKSFNFVENFMKGPKQSFTVGLNLFSDMDEDEKRAFFCTVPTLHNPPPIPSNKRIKKRVTSLDDFSRICGGGIDWSESYASIKSIRSQGPACGSCWAFATTAAVEALHALTFELQPSSNAIRATAHRLQYCQLRGIQRTCDTVKEKGDGLEIDAYAVVNPRNEDQLAYALCEQPVVVGIDAHGTNFEHYRGGIYRSECGTDINHSVLLVGMRIDKATNDQYWILKNSWGEKWGEGGFMKLLKNDGTPGGHCGIAMQASYPQLLEYI